VSRLTPLLTAGAALLLALGESRRPLRKRVEPRGPRTARNLAAGTLTAVVTTALQTPLVARAQRHVTRQRLGILNQLDLSPAARRIIAVLLLDYTLWWWHRANHEVPLLWRFHAFHHADRDLDVTTALRFHAGEMALAAVFRALQIRVIGASADDVATWQRMLLPSIFFHHSNFALPKRLDDLFARILLVTPRMHGIHHSTVREDTDSNYASLFPWWDALHGTLRLDIPQEAITIGLPSPAKPLPRLN
jgi:sterol desaturase/sphingolipid hydroxylase (fatty acid hydroxylase superfamily)